MTAIYCLERRDSGPIRTADTRSFETHWDIFKRRGSDIAPMTQLLAESALRTFAPFALADVASPYPFFANNFEVDMVDGYTATGTVSYRYDDPIDNLPPPQNGEDYSPPTFKTHVENVNIRQSLFTVSATARAGAGARDYKRLIGVTENGDVNGADVPSPSCTFTIPRYYPLQLATAQWRKAMDFLVGTICSHTFMTYAVGEIMLLGIPGGPNVDKQRYEMNLEFATSPNRTNIIIGDITVPSKRGFDHMWASYVDEDQGDWTVKVPQQVNVEIVGRGYASWALLGFGT